MWKKHIFTWTPKPLQGKHSKGPLFSLQHAFAIIRAGFRIMRLKFELKNCDRIQERVHFSLEADEGKNNGTTKKKGKTDFLLMG